MTPELKITKARANLVMAQPFYGTLALRLIPVSTKDIETAAVDGVHIFYNPDFVNKLSLQKVQGLIAHETMHPSFLHHTRRQGRNVMQWNIACDYAINNLLVKSAFELPDDACVGSQYDGMSAEQIYNKLPQNEVQELCKKSSQDPGGCGAVLDAPKEGTGDPETTWKVAVQQAAQAARQAGRLPAHLENLLGELSRPKLPWRDILRRFMTKPSKRDSTWAKPDRRFVAQDIYLPSNYSIGSGEVVVVMDTSGSVSLEEQRLFASEIKGIVEDIRPEYIYVIYCDAAVQRVDKFAWYDHLAFRSVGGGGTNFKPPFEYIKTNGINPECIVYLTDGYGPYPDPPNVPTLWVINNFAVAPPFGEHIVLDI